MLGWLPFKYKTVRWEPPRLPTDQELQIGEQIALLGKGPFIKAFLEPAKSMDTPVQDGQTFYGPGNPPSFTCRPFSKDRAPSKAAPTSKMGKAVGAGLAIGAVAAGISLSPGILVSAAGAGLYAGGAYYGSKRLALWKYNRWLDQCLAKFQALHRAKQV